MNCAGCGHENRAGARFCEECAAPLKRICSSCGAELRPAAKFCDECAAPTAPRATAPAGARKVVTIVFADLVGSTSLHERLDAESARRFMESYYRAMRGAVEAHGGTVTQLLGDGVKAVFGIPRVAEDDAIRAVRAAVEMQRAFRELAEQQAGAVGMTGLRVAVNTGEVVASDASEIIGDPVNVAARLQEQGRDGDVVVGESTQALVADRLTLELLGSFALKGRTEAVSAYRVVSLERPAGAAATAFVGRDAELARISAVYGAALDKPTACLAVLLGSPGLGKSRLIDEFVRRLGDEATVLFAQCDAAGGASFAPLAVAMRQSLGIEASASGDALRAALEAALPGGEAERARIVAGIAGLLAGSPASPEETFFVVRRLLAALAATKPVVLVIDDLHWAEPLLLDLVEHLVQWGSGVPLLVLVSARPEMRDVRSSLATPGGLVADVMTLSGLDAGAAMRLAANVIGAADLPSAVAVKVLTASEGNPLFVGELVRMLVHEGALRKEGDRWTTGTALAALEMPPTIQALLAARIERLRPEERSVLERAAVVGRYFSRSAVAELLPRDVTDLDARLESLRRSELVERDTGWFLGEPVLRFHHVLIRDAAYRRVLKETRADLHARLADWIEARAGLAIEHDETIGWHLEQAHQHLRELGPIDEHGRELGERAARRLGAAGRRALARDDLPLAASLLGRAVAALDPADSGRADLALDWCEALLAAGDVAPAATAVNELGRFTADSARLRAWHTCFAGQLRVLTAPEGLHETADAVSAAAAELTTLGDSAGEAKAHFVYALALARLGKFGGCEAALDHALAAARRADDQRRANTVLAIAPLAALWGPSPVTRASGRCLDVVRVLRITQSAPAVEAVALSCQGVLEALRGRTDAARRMIASSRKMVEELGITHRLLEADVFAGQIELLEGDAAAAERRLRPAFEGLRELGLGIDAARAAALLARALLALGHVAEAEALSHESEALAGDDLKAAIAWRGVRAEALARRGEHIAAVELASRAVEIASATDALLDHADARLALAAALRAAGRGREADAEERRATELWEAKGATLLAERARREVAPVEVVAATPERRAEPAPPARRPVRANAATTCNKRFIEGLGARDAYAIAALVAPDAEFFHHPTGTVYGRDGSLTLLGQLIGARDLEFQSEAIAALGESLALFHESVSFSDLDDDALGPFGAVERKRFGVVEVDASGRQRRVEFFAPDHLGDAIARLYERHAQLLPEGAERARAAATAHSVAALPGSPELWPFAPDVEAIDHRTVGWGSLRGADAVLRSIRTLISLSDTYTNRTDDVLDLRSDALVVRWTNFGTGRASGGAFERKLVELWTFGGDGLLTRLEQFDAEQEAEALARFDELTARAPAPAVRRSVRPSAATDAVARLDAVIDARDEGGLAALLDDSYEVIDHQNSATWGATESAATARKFMRSIEARVVHEPIATLGESLALSRRERSARGAIGDRFDVGEYEHEDFALDEVSAGGLIRRIELFSTDHLGDAIVSLYERYADLLPDGPERDRAAATARSVATLPRSPDRWPFAPDAEARDYRTVGFGSLRGAEALVRAVRALVELTDDWAIRIDDVLGLRSDALFVRWTTSGTLRASGGAFERLGHIFWIFGTDGLVVRWEQFDIGQEAEALARFDELTAEAAPVRSLPRSVRQNAVTVHTSRLEAAIAARDADAIPSLFSDDMETMDHITHTTWDRKAVTSGWRSLARAENPTCRYEPLATLGDSLALCRMSLSASRLSRGNFDVGGYEKTEIRLCEVDAQGRLRRGEVFAVDKFGDALVRFYELHAELLPDAAARDRAVATARSVAAMVNPPELDRLAEAFEPEIETRDERSLGTWSARGAEAVLAHFRSLLEVASEIEFRDWEILGLDPDTLLVRRTHCGTQLAGGGTYERPFLMLLTVGHDGRLTRIHWFDVDREADAVARFEELSKATSRPAAFANAASRAHKESLAAFESRDWTRYRKLMSEGFRFVDRSRVAQLELDRDQRLAYVRSIGEMSSTRAASRLLATRGERLALAHLHLEVSGGDVGPSEIDALFLTETNDRGEMTFEARFGGDDVDAAYAELDARYEAGEAAAHSTLSAAVRARTSAFSRRDWEAFDAIYGPDFVYHDHRLLGFGDIRGGKGYARLMQSLVDLAPDSQFREDHVRRCGRGQLALGTRLGTRDGGAYEALRISVIELDERGEFRRLDSYDLEQLDQARARFEELSSAASPPAVFANAATRALDRGTAALAARDWEGFAALFAADYRNFDRRPLMRIESDREQWLASFRQIVEMTSSPPPHEVLATRGDRLALVRVFWRGAAGDVGPTDIDWLLIIEVNERGDHRVVVVYEPGDLDAAYAELDALFAAGEAALHPRLSSAMREVHHAFATRDWEAFEALYAPDFSMHDHSLLGVGEIRGPKAYINWLRSLLELAPDARFRHDHLRRSAHGQLAQETRLGTRDGGVFEKPQINVHELDQSGKLSRLDGYDPEQLDQALARFSEIRAPSATPAPTRFANAATRIVARVDTCWRNRDWEGYAQLCTAGFRYLDRRRIAQLDLDRDRFIAFIRQIGDMESSRIDFDVLATRGDRLALVRSLTEFSDADLGRSEIDSVLLIETDDRSDMVAMVRFDADDLDAAFTELDARFEAREGALHARVSATMRAFARGWQRRDGKALAALCAPDFVFQDHRPLGFGEIVRDPALWVRTQQALFDLAPDARGRSHHVRLSDRGHLSELTLYGTREGGAFEIPQIGVRELDDLGQLKRIDVFDPGQLDQAFARFAEIGSGRSPDPLRIPPNSATRVWDRLDSCLEAGDWEALRTACAPIVYDDRRPLSRVAGDCEVFIANCRYIREIGIHSLRSPLANLGDRLALMRAVWRLEEDAQISEVETIELMEVDAAGRVTAVVIFDPEDRAAASAELFERYARSGADGSPAALVEFVRSWNDHDLDRMRATLPEDFYFRDHRRTGVGRIENRDAYLASVAALFELSRDVRLESMYLIAAAPHGRVDVPRWFGTNAEGGDFEAVFIRLWLYRDENPLGIELFELEDRDAALARFDELRPDPLSIPTNAATRASARAQKAFRARDWAVHRALAADGFSWEDRGRRALIRGDVEMWVSSAKFRSDVPGGRAEVETLGTAGERLMVDRMVWTGGPDGAEFENVRIRVVEVDDTGRLRAMILYDVEDRGAAFAEALARFASGEAAACPGLAAVAEFVGAFSAHDWDRVRNVTAPDFVFDDHRTIGMGTLDREQDIASMRAQAELGPGLAADVRRIHTWSRRGLVATIRTHGNVRDGGPFENVFLAVFMVAGDHVTRHETFNLADLGRALARFEELGR